MRRTLLLLTGLVGCATPSTVTAPPQPAPAPTTGQAVIVTPTPGGPFDFAVRETPDAGDDLRPTRGPGVTGSKPPMPNTIIIQ